MLFGNLWLFFLEMEKKRSLRYKIRTTIQEKRQRILKQYRKVNIWKNQIDLISTSWPINL